LGEQIWEKIRELQNSGEAEAANLADFLDDAATDLFEQGLSNYEVRDHLSGICNEISQVALKLHTELLAMEDTR